MFRRAAAVAALLALAAPAAAQVTIFENVRIFDGASPELSSPTNVLVRDTLIERISSDPITPEDAAGAVRIAGEGRTLMPGLIDAHVHMIMGAVDFGTLLTADQNYIMLRAGEAAEQFLTRGFTTARDMGGPTFGLKRAIDEGRIVGPRIYPSGATISQT